MRKIFLLLLFLPIYSAKAAYEDRHAEGWHWYEEFKQEKKTRSELKSCSD